MLLEGIGMLLNCSDDNRLSHLLATFTHCSIRTSMVDPRGLLLATVEAMTPTAVATVEKDTQESLRLD